MVNFSLICDTPLWDENFVYDENYPDFTFCFYQTVNWFPCLILWIIFPCWRYRLGLQKNFSISIKKGSIIYTFKMIVTILMILLEIAKLVQAKLHVYSQLTFYITPLIFIFSYGLVIYLNYFEKQKGQKRSLVLFIFWFNLMLISTLKLRSVILGIELKNQDLINFKNIINLVYFILLSVNLGLSSLTGDNTDENEKKGIEDGSVFGWLFWTHIESIIKLAYKRALYFRDFKRLEDDKTSEYLCETLEKEWNKMTIEYYKNLKLEELSKKNLTKDFIFKFYSKQESTTVEETERMSTAYVNDPNTNDSYIESKKPSLKLCLIKIFGTDLIISSFIKLLHDSFILLNPYLFSLLLKFITDSKQNLTTGYFIITLIFTSLLVKSILLQQYFYRMYTIGHKIKTAIIVLIYKKNLKLEPLARVSSSELNSLIATNASYMLELMPFFNYSWSGPLQVFGCLVYLWVYLNVASAFGLVVVILLFFVNVSSINKTKRILSNLSKLQESRTKSIYEVISGIKNVKFSCSELAYSILIKRFRQLEINLLNKSVIYQNYLKLSWVATPIVVSVVSFGFFIFYDLNNKLDIVTVFICITVIDFMKCTLSLGPSTFSTFLKLNSSIDGIVNFLLKDEMVNEYVEYSSNINQSHFAIEVNDLKLSWDKKRVTLEDIRFKVERKKLVAIIGEVGSGKSSLLAGILGEMYNLNENGLVKVNGSIAYVTQQSWLKNESIQKNILFGKEISERYNEIKENCSLSPDLAILLQGDQTEIGDKGINLSGGQKQRISIARALYSDADIYLLDDPLSAIDAHVGKSIFDKVIGPNGMLKNKTRLFVTNSLCFLPQCDSIIMIENGRIINIGRFEELKYKIPPSFHYIDETNNKNRKNETEKIIEKEKNIVSSFKDDSHKHIKQKAALTKTNIGRAFLFYLSATWKYLLCLFTFFLISHYLFQFFTNFWISQWSDDNDNFTKRYDKIICLLVYTFLGTIECLFKTLSDIPYFKASIIASTKLHDLLLNRILRSKLSFYEKTSIGKITNVFSSDINAVDQKLPYSFNEVLNALFAVFLILITITFSTPMFLLSCVPLAIVFTLTYRYYTVSSKQIKKLLSNSTSPIFSHLTETNLGKSVIKAFKCDEYFMRTLYSYLDESSVYFYHEKQAFRWFSLRLEMISITISILASLFTIYYRESLNVGLAAAAISISLTISSAFFNLIHQTSVFEDNISSIETINEYCNVPSEPEWTMESDLRLHKNWPEHGLIHFSNFSAKYKKEDNYVLRDLNFEILPGEKIGIVGKSGSGKSSITLSLFRMIEFSQGDITIDGVNIKEIGLHHLRKNLTIIPQDPFLFSGSLRYNLSPFNNHKDVDLWNSLEMVKLKDFFMEKEKKLDFELKEDFDNISVGQKQLICIARALLNKTKILILDEATASIDNHTNDLIQETVKSNFQDSTTITIAHRLDTIIDSSRILVLEKGEIVEFDTPKNLLSNKNGLFYQLAKDAGLVKT